MLEGPQQPDEVLLVLRVGVAQAAENLRLLETGLVPVRRNCVSRWQTQVGSEGEAPMRAQTETADSHALLAPDNLDRDLPPLALADALSSKPSVLALVLAFALLAQVPRTHNVREHALAEIGDDVVAAVVEGLAENDAVVALSVVVVVGEKRSSGVRGQCGGKSAVDKLERRGQQRRQRGATTPNAPAHRFSSPSS